MKHLCFTHGHDTEVVWPSALGAPQPYPDAPGKSSLGHEFRGLRRAVLTSGEPRAGSPATTVTGPSTDEPNVSSPPKITFQTAGSAKKLRHHIAAVKKIKQNCQRNFKIFFAAEELCNRCGGPAQFWTAPFRSQWKPRNRRDVTERSTGFRGHTHRQAARSEIAIRTARPLLGEQTAQTCENT